MKVYDASVTCDLPNKGKYTFKTQVKAADKADARCILREFFTTSYDGLIVRSIRLSDAREKIYGI